MKNRIKIIIILVLCIYNTSFSQKLILHDSVSFSNTKSDLQDSFPLKESLFLNSEWTLKINEFLASNETVFADEYGEYDDWIELFNFGEDTVDINGLYLTDELSDPEKWQITSPIIIYPDSFLVLWADNQPEQGDYHLGFKLSASGEAIGLFTPDSLLCIDSVIFGIQNTDISCGRQPDGGEIWNYFEDCTPGYPNSDEGLLGIIPEPQMTVAAGIYSSQFDVELTIDSSDAIIYYTLDNTVPTISSSIYSGAIAIEQTTVLRAKAFQDGYIPSSVATATYIFDQDFTLDIISLVTEPSNMWGSSGIYDNPYSGLEKPIHFEYFKPNGNLEFNLDGGIRIHGPDGRPQKSFRFYARSQYGDNEINYKLFIDKDINVFKRLVLRNAGNDGLQLSKTHIRDSLMHIIYQQSNPENGMASYIPLHVYLNGQYWGIYNLREREDKYYIKYNFGYEDIDFLEYTAGVPNCQNAIAGDWLNFNNLKNFVINNDLSINSNYQYVCSQMDIENFVDYQIFEIFCGNQDWLSNNIKFWRQRSDEGKWRWVLWDTEYGLGTYYPNYSIGYPDFNFLNMALTWGGWGSGDYTYLLRNLVENEDFKEYFCIRFADLLNTELLENSNIIDVIDSLQLLLSPDVQLQINKWGSSYDYWIEKIQEVKNFSNGRPYYIREHIIDEFELDTLFTLSLNVQPAESGKIIVNTKIVEDFPWSGIYFTDYSTCLTAVPNDGYEFTNWQGIYNGSSFIEFFTSNDTSFTALFQPIVDTTNFDTAIVINEINYHSADFMDSGDWVEIYNTCDSTIDLSNWKFYDSDDLHVFTIQENIEICHDSFLILCRDTVKFKTIHSSVTNYIGNFDFGLSNGGEFIRLYNQENQLIDSVEYDDESPWPVSPDGNGPSLELKNPDLDNTVPENWQASYIYGGTPGSTNSIPLPLPKLKINEFMADNESTITDPQGEYADWIEIYNADVEAYDLGGLYFTDDLNENTKYKIPTTEPDSTTIQAGEYLILWADKDTESGVLHLDFKLSASGEQIGIFTEDGVYPIDTLTFGVQQADISMGLMPNGGEDRMFFTVPTPGLPNGLNQIIQMPQGWSGISSYLIPYENEIEKIFSLVKNEIVIVSDGTGIYWPAQNINTIGSWDEQGAFQIKTNKEVNITIESLTEADKEIELLEGWTIIPVLCKNAVNCEELFSGIIDELVIVKEIAGCKVYWPSMGINTLEYLIPGKAYIILVNEECEFEYQ